MSNIVQVQVLSWAPMLQSHAVRIKSEMLSTTNPSKHWFFLFPSTGLKDACKTSCQDKGCRCLPKFGFVRRRFATSYVRAQSLRFSVGIRPSPSAAPLPVGASCSGCAQCPSAFEPSAGRMACLSIALSTNHGRTSASQANVRGSTRALGRLHT